MEMPMPHNLESEIALLGSAIHDPACIGEIMQVISADAFYRPAHGLIWRTLVEMYDKRVAIDIVTLKDALNAVNLLKQIGGHEYLMALVESVPTAANAAHYAKIVKEKSIRRNLITACGSVMREAAGNEGEVEDLLDKAEREIFELIRSRTSCESHKLSEIVRPTIDKFAEIRDKGSAAHLWGLSSGFRDIDAMTCGLQGGQLVIIAGRPSMGKSTWVLNVATHLAIDQKKAVMIFSLEMGKEAITENMLCSRARVSVMALRKGHISDEGFSKLLLVAGEFMDAPLYVDDSSGLSALELRARARRYQTDYGIALFIIDYLQMMEVKGPVENRQQEVTLISRSLKTLARELKVPVIAVSQLSRATEQRGDKRPRISDLRESGSLEQDADLVLLLYRPGYYTRDPNDKVCEVDVAKQRCGPTGVVKLIFRDDLMRFDDYAMTPSEGARSEDYTDV